MIIGKNIKNNKKGKNVSLVFPKGQLEYIAKKEKNKIKIWFYQIHFQYIYLLMLNL